MKLFKDSRPLCGQDPFVVKYQDSYLLIQSSHEDTRIVIKQFDSLNSIKIRTTIPVWIPPLGSDHGEQLWAPELHHIDGKWFIYYAASNGQNHNHRMYVLESEDGPFGPYEDVGKIGDNNWAIDMTILEHQGSLYAIWSGWDYLFSSFPQNLYIAHMSDPKTISGKRVRISSPTFHWEKSVAPINEGPQTLKKDDRLFIVYAADASWMQEYKTGLLEFTGKSILDPNSWKKDPFPLIINGGHGHFVEDKFICHRKTSHFPGWSDREIVTIDFDWTDYGPVLYK